jgi:hypothetical protein
MSGKSATGMYGWYSNAADADLGEQLQQGNAGLPCSALAQSLFYVCIVIMKLLRSNTT